MDTPIVIQKPSAKEYFMFCNNMVSVIKGLEGDYTAIDLRDESSVTGKIINVDGYMNIEMEDCHFYNSRGNTYPFKSFYIKGRNIRYVHVPPEKKAIQLIQNELHSTRKSKQVIDKKLTFKQKRAKEYQAQTLLDISQKVSHKTSENM